MLFFRSALFNICFMLLTPIFSILIMCGRLFGGSAAWWFAKAWSHSLMSLLKVICGIHIVVEGKEHVPDEACVVMAKHQSAAETVIMPMLIPDYTWILKRELFYIPIFGWALIAMGTIGIRRGSPRAAIKQVIKDGSAKLKQGLWVVIFPEGTRSAVGTSGEYQPGGAILAQKAKAGILPLAHNTGTVWPKRGFIKKPGTITFRFLPYISVEEVSSIRRNDLLARLAQDIEAATRELGG